MKGVYKVEVGTKKLKYVLTLKRNITIIRGDTATGKTTLIKFLISASDFDDSSGIKVKCEKECIVLSGKKWETDLSSIHDSIVFIDEHNGFIESKDFAKAVANSDNYYVLFTRANLPNLPYSIEEIYEFKSTGRLEKGESVYNSMHRLYSSNKLSTSVKPTMIITEDSNAGYSLFSKVSCERGIKCISAGGKSNIEECIGKHIGERVLIIADGAAFGCEMNEVMRLIMRQSNYTLYLPESFEWLVLKSGIIRSKRVEEILQHPENYIESSEYLSWERYFTNLLEGVTDSLKGVSKYNKNRALDKSLTTPKCVAKIIEAMKGIDLD